MDFSAYSAEEIEQIAKAMKIQEQKKIGIIHSSTMYDHHEEMMEKVMIDSEIFKKIKTLGCGRGWFRSICHQDKLHYEYSKIHYALPDTPQLTFLGINGGTRSFPSPTEEQYKELLKRYDNKDSKYYDPSLKNKIEIAQENLIWLKENQFVPKATYQEDEASFPWTTYGESSNNKVVVTDKSESEKVDIHKFNLLKDSVEILSKKVMELQEIIEKIQKNDTTSKDEVK